MSENEINSERSMEWNIIYPVWPINKVITEDEFYVHVGTCSWLVIFSELTSPAPILATTHLLEIAMVASTGDCADCLQMKYAAKILEPDHNHKP